MPCFGGRLLITYHLDASIEVLKESERLFGFIEAVASLLATATKMKVLSQSSTVNHGF